MKHRYFGKGFSLIELLVVLTIAAILLITAVPTLNNIAESNERRAVVHGLLTFFASARRQSITTHQILTLCPINAESKCGTDWNSELYLFVDPMNQRKITEFTDIVGTLAPPSTGTLKTRSLSGSYYQYRPNGMILSDLGNITWCPNSRDLTKAAHLLISRGGLVRLARDVNGDGIPDRPDGTAIEC